LKIQILLIVTPYQLVDSYESSYVCKAFQDLTLKTKAKFLPNVGNCWSFETAWHHIRLESFIHTSLRTYYLT